MTGIDFDANARLGRGIIMSGGVSIGRERTNSCALANDLSLVFQSGVGAGTGSGVGILAPRTPAYCDVHPPFQPNVKGQIAYPIPWRRHRLADVPERRRARRSTRSIR